LRRDHPRALPSSPTRRSSDLTRRPGLPGERCWEVPPLSVEDGVALLRERASRLGADAWIRAEGRVLEEVVARLDGSPLALELARSEEHTSELQSRENLVCRLL